MVNLHRPTLATEAAAADAPSGPESAAAAAELDAAGDGPLFRVSHQLFFQPNFSSTKRHRAVETQSRDYLSVSGMTKCVELLRHLATSSTKSSNWSVLIGPAGTKSD
jgi:hypothetical protein